MVKNFLLGLVGVWLLFYFSRIIGIVFPNSQPSMTNLKNPTDLKNLIKLTLGVTDNFAWILASQSAHETGYWKSDVCIKNRNLFGMRKAKVRPRVQLGEALDHATYVSYCDSVKDMGLYLKYVGLLNFDGTIEQYVRALKSKHYFTDSVENYLRGVKAASTLIIK